MADYEDLTLETPDKVKIKAFLILQSDKTAASRPTVLLLHANAGNVVSCTIPVDPPLSVCETPLG